VGSVSKDNGRKTMSRLEDHFEIENLHTLFAYAADRADYALLRSLYTDDAVDNHGDYNGPVDGYIDWVKETHKSFAILSHINARPLIAIDGDTAESETKGHVYIRTKGPPAYSAFIITRSFDKYRRTADGWRFTSRLVCGDWSGPTFDPVAVGGEVIGAMDQTDPVYKAVPKLVAQLKAMSSRFASRNE
jgi:hypothetical protein